MNYRSVLAVLQFAVLVSSKVIVDVEEEVYDCGNSQPNSAADFSNLKYTLDDDDVLIVNGRVDINEDYEAPIGLNLRSEHLERGEWRPGFLSMTVIDFCPQILDPLKPWYPVTKTFNQTFCPYRKGHVEIMDNFKWGTFGIYIPFNMLGDWKLYYEISTKRNGVIVKECDLQRVYITDG